MTAEDAIRLARTTGVRISVRDGELLLSADEPPPPEVVQVLRRHKQEIINQLTRPVKWTAEDWQAFFDERAALGEYEGELSRFEAEKQAFEGCIAEWLNSHSVETDPANCVACGGGNHPSDPLLPYGVSADGHAWLHTRCWREWSTARRRLAARELAKMGIRDLSKSPDDFGKNGRG